MLPKTNFEKQVVASNERLTAISPKAVDWTVKHLIEHTAFRTKSNATTCGDCGHKFQHEGKATVVKCPKCGQTLKVKDTLKRTIIDRAYFSTFDVANGLQVQRVFLLTATFRKGSSLQIDCDEVCRLWINYKGKTAITSRKRSLGYYMDSFNWGSPIELRSSITQVHLVIADTYIYPRYKVIPELKRNGIKGSLPECHPFLLIKLLLSDSRIETLMKAGNLRAVKYFVENPGNLDLCWNSLKIAIRHGYKITDFHLWCDTIRMLDKCGRDIRSTRYICPANLKAEHDKWSRKVMLMEKKRRDEEQMIRAKKKEEEFYRTKSCFFGIVISDNDIEISVLDSIEAYKAEGDAMHHCVFSNSYYSKPDSIVLSAHDKEGKRIETIEFSLSQNKVIQSQGVCNKTTELHHRIVNLVNSNAHRFIKARATA